MIAELPSQSVLESLPVAVLVVDQVDTIMFANPSTAEQFFQTGVSTLLRSALPDLVTEDNPLLSLIAKTRKHMKARYENSAFECRHHGCPHTQCDRRLRANRQFTWTSRPEFPRARFCRPSRRCANTKSSARSLRGMAAMMAHEVKNPLSGVRGAAQLLEQSVPFEDRQLTRLIIEETDRICKLVDEMDAFTENPRFERDAVNIHEVLDRVVEVAKRGFGANMTILQEYDPSLPPSLAIEIISFKYS